MVKGETTRDLESRAAEMEKRLAALEEITSNLDSKDEGTSAEGVDKVEKVTEVAKSEMQKLKYQVKHLKRSLKEAEIRDAEAVAKAEAEKLKYRVAHLRKALKESDRKAHQAAE